MRVELINPYGVKLTVDESKKEEYIARGCALASAPVSLATEEPKPEKKKKTPVRKKA